MAKQKRQHNPGDAANAFIRVLLSEAGRLAGGLTDSEWECTLAYFDHCCAYTGEPLTKENTQQEHAIPINQDSCGLHLYGNVVPATQGANRSKGNKHYKEFLKDYPHRLHRIEQFMEDTRYHERTKPFDDIRLFCQAQYKLITSLCEANKEYLEKLMGPTTSRGHESDGADPNRVNESDSTTVKMGHDNWDPKPGTIGALAKDCITKGFSNEETLECVRNGFPKSRTKTRDISWYRWRMRKADRSIPSNGDIGRR